MEKPSGFFRKANFATANFISSKSYRTVPLRALRELRGEISFTLFRAMIEAKPEVIASGAFDTPRNDMPGGSCCPQVFP